MRKLKIAQIGVRHEHADGKMDAVRINFQDVFEVVGIAAESPEWAETVRDKRAFKGLWGSLSVKGCQRSQPAKNEGSECTCCGHYR